MKKLFVLLLALTVVAGAAFAEDPALAIAGEVFGKFGLVSDGTPADAVVADSNVGFYLDFDWTDGVYGISTEMEVDYPDSLGALYFNYAYGFANIFDGMVKVSGGYLWNSSYRLRNTMLNTMMGGLINETGAAIEFFPVEGLAIAFNLPMPAAWGIANGVSASTTEFADALKEFDIFAKYKAEGIGTFYASYQATDVNNVLATDPGTVVNFGVDLTMVENAQIQAGYNLTGIGHAIAANENVSKIYLLGSYTMDALKITEEVNLAFGADMDMTWLSQTTVAYRPADIRFQLAARVWNNTTLDSIKYRLVPAVRFYKGSNYWNVQFQLDGDTDSSVDMTWNLPVSYSIAF